MCPVSDERKDEEMDCEKCGGKGYLPLMDPSGEPNPKLCPDCASDEKYDDEFGELLDDPTRERIGDT